MGRLIQPMTDSVSQAEMDAPVASTGVPSHGSQTRSQFERQRMEMLENGWCSHQIDYLAKIHDPGTFSYFAQLHRLRFGDHQRCPDQICCVAYNAHMENYTTKHVIDSCTCGLVQVPYKKIIKILRRGEIPLVSLYDSDDGGLGLQVSKRRSSTQYIAISHVWADGLGNPRQNALPACQLKKLQNHLAQTWRTKTNFDGTDPINPNGSLRFWMDTLCIPVNSEHKGLRLMSIDMMASIYAAASCVLVLDSELLSLRTSGLPKTELFAHILSSIWMCRSWTLQEGVLSRDCAIQFEDRTVILSEFNLNSEVYRYGELDEYLWHNFLQLRWTREDGTFFSNIVRQLIPIWETLTGHTLSEDDDRSAVTVDQFTRVWNALAGRSTTMIEDQYIILANVLDLPLLPLIPLATSQERMQRIILSLDQVPFSLFVNVSPSQSSENMSQLDSWIPSRVTSDILTAKSKAKVMSGYLKLENASLGNDLELSIYQVAECIPHSSTYYLLVPGPPENRRYKIDATTTATHGVEDDRYCSTILIVQDKQVSGDEQVLGACFYTSESPGDESSRGHGIQLVFCCSVRISKITANDTSRSETISRDYIARELPKYSNISIKYSPPSNFKPLKKRRGDIIPLPHFLMSLGVALVAAIAALAAIDYGIIHHLLKNSKRSSGTILLIIITIVFLNLFIAAGLTLLFASVWYLALGHIFVPLYHRSYIRSFEAHICQKPLQGSQQQRRNSLLSGDLVNWHLWGWSNFSKLFFKKRPKSDPDVEIPI